MTDRELLILAAKAAGYNAFDYHAEQMVDGYWNPLTDDDDALRLAVKLQLDFYVDGKQAGCWIDDFVCLVEDINGDPYAATRRATVRAAAAIGEKL